MSFLSTLSAQAAPIRHKLRQQILAVGPDSFEPLALAVFRYQAVHNPVYRSYLHHLGIRPTRITNLSRVPFMPIDFFKKHPILTGLNPENGADALTFVSSGTTNQTETSHHLVPDPALYDTVSIRIFEDLYGPLQNVHILALLPSYLERNNSSLVYMVQQFMDRSGSGETGQTGAAAGNFFLHDLDALTDRLRQLTGHPDGKRILLIGVTFALLDWAESAPDLGFLQRNPNLVVMETGGMKGRRNELLREEVHEILTRHLGVSRIHSEYGMTELLSQAYSVGEGLFRSHATLRVLLRDINDPFQVIVAGQAGGRQTGGINVVDLANLDSCSFVETQDLGQYTEQEGLFRVIGRFDNSDVRGCNLLVL